jgi:hypothetical protein
MDRGGSRADARRARCDGEGGEAAARSGSGTDRIAVRYGADCLIESRQGKHFRSLDDGTYATALASSATLLDVDRTCYFHAGCPDGFGAAWAVWRAWGEDANYVPRGHEREPAQKPHVGGTVVFVDIAPDNEYLRELAEHAARVIVLDHHLTARDRYHAEPGVENVVDAGGHEVIFDLEHSGAMLAWNYFHPGVAPPDLLCPRRKRSMRRSDHTNASSKCGTRSPHAARKISRARAIPSCVRNAQKCSGHCSRCTR